MKTVPFSKFDSDAMLAFSDEASRELGKDYWRLFNSLSYDIGYKGSDRKVIVPAGYLTDGASVPRIFWWVVSPQGRHGAAAIIHDYLCEYLTVYDKAMPTPITRKEADEIFKEALVNTGLSRSLVYSMFAAVSLYRITFGVKGKQFSSKKAKLEIDLNQKYK